MRIYCGFALLLAALMPPGNVSIDGASMLAVATSLATHGSIAVPCDVGIPGEGGRCFSTFYPLQSILAAPLVGVGRAAAAAVGQSQEYIGEFAAQLVPTLAAAGVATFTVLFAREFGASRNRAILAGLTSAFATEVAVYYRSFFADVLAAALVLVVVWGFYRGSRLWAGVGIALLILAKPQMVLIGVLLGAVFALSRRERQPLVMAVAATAIGSAAYVAYNVARFGDPWNFGGEAREIHGSALSPASLVKAFGLLTISPGRGVLLYSPIAILGIYALVRRRCELAWAALAVFVGALALHLANPGRGYNWGSRYLVAAVPLTVAAAWSLKGRVGRLAPVLALLGVLLVAPTFPGFYQRAFAEHEDRGGRASDMYWSLSDNPGIAVWGSTRRQIDDARRQDVREIVNRPNVATAHQTVADQKFYSVVAQWWWMTPAARIPRVLGALAALAMLALGAVLLMRAGTDRREPRGAWSASSGQPGRAARSSTTPRALPSDPGPRSGGSSGS
jgi:hypothetical protein